MMPLIVLKNIVNHIHKLGSTRHEFEYWDLTYN